MPHETLRERFECRIRRSPRQRNTPDLEQHGVNTNGRVEMEQVAP